MPSPDTVRRRAASAPRGCHYSAQQSDRMCSTAENPSAARIASCRCSWPGPPRHIVGESHQGIKSAPATNRQNPLCSRDVWEIPAQRTGQQCYQPFADWLVDQEVCNRAIPLGGNVFGGKWGTPDVIGKRDKQPGDIVEFPTEIVSAEI